MPIELVMPSSHHILCHPLLLLPPIPPSIRVFSSELTLPMRWPKYWSFSFSINPSNEHAGLISFRMDWLDLLADQGTLKSLLQHRSSKASILWCLAFFMVAFVGHLRDFYEYFSYSKHLLPTPQEMTLHVDITRWSVKYLELEYCEVRILSLPKDNEAWGKSGSCL